MENEATTQVQSPKRSRLKQGIMLVVLIVAILLALVVLSSAIPRLLPKSYPPFVWNRTDPSITYIDLSSEWKQLTNQYYHYRLNVPRAAHSTDGAAFTTLYYWAASNLSAERYGELRISTMGILDEPLEVTASRMGQLGEYEKKEINGYEAIVFKHAEDTEITIIRNSYNLNISIYAVSEPDTKYRQLLKDAVQSFEFIDQDKIDIPSEMTVSGYISLLTGNNCGDNMDKCKKEVISTDLIVYPAKNFVREDYFLGNPKPDPVTTSKSDEKGYYTITLPPGSYTIYAGKNDPKLGCSRLGDPLLIDFCGMNITLYESDVNADMVMDFSSNL